MDFLLNLPQSDNVEEVEPSVEFNSQYIKFS